MSACVCDASVVVKWYLARDEEDLRSARRLAEGCASGAVRVFLLELALYEVGNALSRRSRAPARLVAAALADLADRAEETIGLTPAVRAFAAALAERHRLTFYDAAHLGLAVLLRLPLVTADRDLLAVGGTSPVAFVEG